MLSNAYFLAKFRFDTAENEPAKKLQKLQKFANFPNFANYLLPNQPTPLRPEVPPQAYEDREALLPRGGEEDVEAELADLLRRVLQGVQVVPGANTRNPAGVEG